jgi:uncharacterized integral membrane protein
MTRTRDDRRMIDDDDLSTSPVARIKLAVGIVALAALALFLLQNLQEVEVHFLWFDWSTRMLWALLASAAFGGIATFLIGTLRRRHSRDDG